MALIKRVLHIRFKDVGIDHAFSSPYERAIDTAETALSGKNLTINVEPGLIEVQFSSASGPNSPKECFSKFQSLYVIRDSAGLHRTPGFEDAEKLSENHPFVNLDYTPVFPKVPAEKLHVKGCKVDSNSLLYSNAQLSFIQASNASIRPWKGFSRCAESRTSPIDTVSGCR